MALAPGQKVPEFRLQRYDLSYLTREDILGRRTLFVFYPFAFSQVCTDQLSVYNQVLDDLADAGVECTYAVSCDNVHAQHAFQDHLGLEIEQLSDWEPKGETCRAFDVMHEAGFPQRALVIVDADGVVEWSHQADSIDDLPGVNLIFDALQEA